MRWCLQEVLLDGSQRRSFRYRGLQVALKLLLLLLLMLMLWLMLLWLLWYVVVVVVLDDVRDDAVTDGDSGLDV